MPEVEPVTRATLPSRNMQSVLLGGEVKRGELPCHKIARGEPAALHLAFHRLASRAPVRLYALAREFKVTGPALPVVAAVDQLENADLVVGCETTTLREVGILPQLGRQL